MRDGVINQAEQKENNLSVVLRWLMTDRDCTRVKLAAKTGLAQATVTKIVSQLIAWGVVSEQESIGTGVGRRAIRLHLNAESYVVAAVRINRDNISAALIDLGGNLVVSSRCETGFEEGAQVSMEKLKQMLARLMEASAVPVLAIGAAVPGPFSYRKRRISLMSGFPGWSGIDIQGELERTFSLPVYVEHDANCGAVAELWRSEYGKRSNVLFVVSDMGVGAGMILDSRLYRGKDGYAGEIGHASICFDGPLCECGNRGCLELYASLRALERRYAGMEGMPQISGEEIIHRAVRGEPEACDAYTATVHALGCGIVGVANIINPDTIVFSGRMTLGGSLFINTVRDVLQQRLRLEQMEQLTLRISTIPGDPMLLGAGITAFTNMLETPTIFFDRQISTVTGGDYNG